MTDEQSGPWLQATRLHKAATLLDINRPAEAAAIAAQEVASNPAEPSGWMVLARCLSALEDYSRALEAVGHAISLDPSDSNSHLIASRVNGCLGNRKEAVRTGQQAVELAPMNASTMQLSP